ncbi:MAG: nucleotidyltransferase family protein [Chloroflexota bacterium]
MTIRIDPKAISTEALADFASRHGVLRVALFGSAARNELRPASDVDVVVDFAAQSTAGLFEQVRMADELENLFGRPVDLVTRDGLRPHVRATVEREAIVLYEA